MSFFEIWHTILKDWSKVGSLRKGSGSYHTSSPEICLKSWIHVLLAFTESRFTPSVMGVGGITVRYCGMLNWTSHSSFWIMAQLLSILMSLMTTFVAENFAVIANLKFVILHRAPARGKASGGLSISKQTVTFSLCLIWSCNKADFCWLALCWVGQHLTVLA